MSEAASVDEYEALGLTMRSIRSEREAMTMPVSTALPANGDLVQMRPKPVPFDDDQPALPDGTPQDTERRVAELKASIATLEAEVAARQAAIRVQTAVLDALTHDASHMPWSER